MGPKGMGLKSDSEGLCIPSLSRKVYESSLRPVKEYGTSYEQVSKTKDLCMDHKKTYSWVPAIMGGSWTLAVDTRIQ